MHWRLSRYLLGRMDWGMLLALLILMGLGVLFIYSAAYHGDEKIIGLFYKRQMVWCLIGAVVYYFLLMMDYHRLGHASWLLYMASILLLVLVFFIGKKVYGAYRWLSLFGMQVQPSEFAKITTLMVTAHFLSQPGRNPRDPRCLILVCLLVGIPFLLILKEPDLGTAATLLPMAFFMLYVAGVPSRSLGLLLVIGLLMLPLAWFGLDEYQKNRLLVFFDSGRDPLGAGWNKIQSEIAVGSGGLTGKGYLKGTQNVLGFLPRTVAPTDFIFPVIAEEMGFMGSVLVLSLFAVVLISCMRTALLARDKLGRLLAVGVATLFFCHVFINIAMTIGLMPITGLPLPLISYGGSFMVATMLGLGMVQSVYVRRYRR